MYKYVYTLQTGICRKVIVLYHFVYTPSYCLDSANSKMQSVRLKVVNGSVIVAEQYQSPTIF